MLASIFKKRQPSTTQDSFDTLLQDQEPPFPVADESSGSFSRTPERSFYDASSTTPDGVVISSWLAQHPNRSTFRPIPSSSAAQQQLSLASPSNNSKLQTSMSSTLTPIKKLFSRSRSASLGEADEDAAGRKQGGQEQWYTPDKSEVEAYQQVMGGSPIREGDRSREEKGEERSTSTLLQPPSPHLSRSPYRSPKASQSSPSLLPRSPSSEEPFYSFHQQQEEDMMPAGTPNFGKRGILREGEQRQPRTGNSVRFFSRDAVCIISPNASLVSQSIDSSPIQQQQYPIFSSSDLLSFSSSEPNLLSASTSSLADEQTIDQSLHRGASTSPQAGPLPPASSFSSAARDFQRYDSTSPLSSPAVNSHNNTITPVTPGNASSFLDRIRDVSASPGTPTSVDNRTIQHQQFVPDSPAPSSSSLSSFGCRPRTRTGLSSVIQYEENEPEVEQEREVSDEQQQQEQEPDSLLQLHTLDSEDESNLFNQSEKLADADSEAESIPDDRHRHSDSEEEGETQMMQLEDLQMSADRRGGEKEGVFVQSLARPLSHSFPYVSLESSGRSYATGEGEDVDDPTAEFHTVVVEESDTVSPEMEIGREVETDRAQHQSTTSPSTNNAQSSTSSHRSTTPPGTPAAVHPYTREPSNSPAFSPPSHLISSAPASAPPNHNTNSPSPAHDQTIYHTPSRTPSTSTTPNQPSSAGSTSSYFNSSHSGDRTSWHTPRSAAAASVGSRLRNQLHLAADDSPSASSSLNEDGDGEGDDPDTSLVPFNLQKSFAQSLVDKGFSPSPAHSQSYQLQQHISSSSDFYLSIDPSSPSASRQLQLGDQQSTIFPSNLSAPQILALNAEFYAAQQNAIKVAQDKYELQREIAEELEGALGRREEEIKRLKALSMGTKGEVMEEKEQDGEVRDLEIRLESERRESARLRSELLSTQSERNDISSREAELQALVGGLEDEIKEMEIRHLRRREEDGDGEEAEGEEGGEKKEELVRGLREKLAERDLAVWELRREFGELKKKEEKERADEKTEPAAAEDREALLQTIQELRAQLELAQTIPPPSVPSVDTPSPPAQQNESTTPLLSSSSSSSSARSPSSVPSDSLQAEILLLQTQSAKDQSKLAEVQGELENQWKMADRAWSEIEELKGELGRVREEGKTRVGEVEAQLAQAQATNDTSTTSHTTHIASLTSQIETLTSETTRLSSALELTEAEFLSLGEVLAEIEAERDQLLSSSSQQEEIVAERDEALASLDELIRERDEVVLRLEEVEKEKEEIVAAQEERTRGEDGKSEEEEQWLAERDQILEEREEFMKQRDEAWEELDAMQIKLDEAQAEVEAINVRTATMEASLLSSVEQVQDLTSRHAVEIAQLVQLRASHADALASKEHHLAQSRKYRDLFTASDTALSSTSSELAELKQRLDTLEEESASKARTTQEQLEQAEEIASKKIRDLTRTIASQTSTISSLQTAQEQQRAVFESAIRDRASAEISAQMSSTRGEADHGELERLSKEVVRLRSEEAQKELRILHLTRSRAEVRECLEGLEIALDSKQQELELVKRKFGVRGVAGSQTPAAKPATTNAFAPPSSTRRRESLATTLAKATAAPDTPNAVAPTPAPRSRSRQSLASVQDTPTTSSDAFSRGSMRPRTSLAMGTPGLHRNPSVARPRSSLGVASSASTSSMAPPPPPPVPVVPSSETTPVATTASSRRRPSTVISQPTPTSSTQPTIPDTPTITNTSHLPRSNSHHSSLSATTASTRSRSSASNHTASASETSEAESEAESIATSSVSAHSTRSSSRLSASSSSSALALNRSTNSNASTSTATSRIPLSTSTSSNLHSRRASLAAIDATPRKIGSNSASATAAGRRLSTMNVPSTPATNARLARRGSSVVRPASAASNGDGGEKENVEDGLLGRSRQMELA